MGEESELRTETNESNKRKLDEGFEIAKQKAQEIAARLNSEAESKRPRFDSHSSEPVLYSNPPLSDGAQQFQPTASTQAGSVPFSAQPVQYYGLQGTSKKMSIPNGKVGVIIGKGGETIKYLQQQSGAKIQITKDTEADPYSSTRDVELTGTTEQISRAEQLVNDVIAETDTGGSAPSSNRVFNLQPGAEQLEMKVPNNKVALLIGKGGETIKAIQTRSGARMQIIPLRLPPGDTSMERSVFISGGTEQIESAKELVNEIINENRLRNPPVPSSYVQPVYTPPGNWATPAQSSLQQQQQQQQQQPGYGYAPTYSTQPSYYGNYSTQQAGWDQSNPSAMPPPPQQSSGYSYPQQNQSGSVPPDQSYSYSQTPALASQSYNQGYSQQPPSYGQAIPSQAVPHDQQNPYMTSGYGPSAPSSQLGGTTPSSQPLPVYPYAYNQQMAPPQAGYGTSQSYNGPPPGSTQTGYGVQQPVQGPPVAAPPVYGQTGYPSQVAPAPSNYTQGMNPPVYGQPQPATHATSQPSGPGAEINGDGSTAAGYGAPPVAQESARSQT